MKRPSSVQADSIPRIRAELTAHLRQRSAEIEEAVFARVRALSDRPGIAESPEYTAGLRTAVAAGVDYGLSGIEGGPQHSEPIPLAATAQARRAAREGVRLDTVLRRYAAGDRLLGEFIMDESDRFPSQALRQILRAQGPHVDRLMAAMAAEYTEELEAMRRSPAQRLAEGVQRLLGGDEPLGAEELGYELNRWHLGLVATGAGAEGAVRALAARFNREALVVPRDGGVLWAWLGGAGPLGIEDVEGLLPATLPGEVSLAVGEARLGIEGWRLTHREAEAGLEVLLRTPQRLTRGRDVLLLAAVVRDEALAKSLLETYVEPLAGDDGSGAVLQETLRAYFAAGFNAATAAAALRVDRHTVQRRLRKVEETLGRLLHSCHAELEVALSLERLEAPLGDIDGTPWSE